MIDTAFNIKYDHGTVGLKQVATSSSETWQPSTYVNDRTRMVYAEEDCKYTFCKTPMQVLNDSRNTDHQKISIMQLNEKETMKYHYPSSCYLF